MMAKLVSFWLGLCSILAVNAADKTSLRSEPRILLGSCPSGFSLLSGSSTLCVKYMPAAKEYLVAQQDCRDLGAELVSIMSSQENYALAALISGQTFVGARDQDSEGHWYWEDHQPFWYTNWGAGQPDNTWGYENCLAILPTGLWNDYICWFGLPSICGVRLVTPTMSPTLYPTSLPGDSTPGSSSSSSSSVGITADPFTISIICAVVSFVVILSCIAVRMCCRSSSPDVYTSPPAVPYNHTQHQAMPSTVAVVSSAPSAPPMAEVYADSSKGSTTTAVVAFADTSSGQGGIELQPVASAPPAGAAYAASVPFPMSVVPTTVNVTSAVGTRSATTPAPGPITTYGHPAYVCTVTYM